MQPRSSSEFTTPMPECMLRIYSLRGVFLVMLDVPGSESSSRPAVESVLGCCSTSRTSTISGRRFFEMFRRLTQALGSLDVPALWLGLLVGGAQSRICAGWTRHTGYGINKPPAPGEARRAPQGVTASNTVLLLSTDFLTAQAGLGKGSKNSCHTEIFHIEPRGFCSQETPAESRYLTTGWLYSWHSNTSLLV